MRFLRLAFASLWALALLAVGAAASAAALVAQGGRLHHRLDVLTHFAPFWLALGLISVAMALPFRPPHLRLLLMAPGLIGAVAALTLIAPEYLRKMSPRAPADAPQQIKLIQFNTWGHNTEVERTAQWIADQAADLVVIEEARPDVRDAILRRRPYYVTCAKCTVMIFSRARPIANDAPKHPDPWPYLPVARASFAAKDGGYTVLGTHYTWPTGGDAQQRQGRKLNELLAGFDRRRLILAGDFNSTPWSFSRRREDKMFGMERRTRALFSWPAGSFTRHRFVSIVPWLPIDHVYAGSAWRTVSVQRGPRLGSDHYPVVVRLALEP